MPRTLQVEPLTARSPEIGRWLWALEEVRARTHRLIDRLDQRILDWEGPDGRENAIGSLLYHIAYVEMGWLFFDMLGKPFPPQVQSDLPYEMDDGHGRLSRVLGVPLAEHLGRLKRSRTIALETLREIPIEDWRRLRHPSDEDYEVTPEWAVFHLVEHEAGHAFQISSLKARATRLFAAGAHPEKWPAD